MKDARQFVVKDGEEEATWEFRRPSQKVLNKAELIYRAKFSEALRNGLLLSAEATKVLKERGLWDAAQEVEEREMRDEIAKLEGKLEDKTLSNKAGKDLCSKIADLRVKLSEHGSVVSSTMENTCESIANDERNQFLTAECVYYADSSQKVYKDVDDFKSRRDKPGAIDAYREAIISSLEVVVGRELPSDLTEEYAENKWLSTRKLDEDKEEKPVKKKRAKKKTSKVK